MFLYNWFILNDFRDWVYEAPDKWQITFEWDVAPVSAVYDVDVPFFDKSSKW